MAAVVAVVVSACSRCEKQENPQNEVVKTIMERRSIRQYQAKPVPRDLLQTLAECGVNAPSGNNRQPWQVRIVDNPDYIAGITAVYVAANPKAAEDASFKNMFRNAPAVIFVASPRSGAGQLDCGMLGENIMLAAHAMGLGTCCLGGPIRFMNTNPDAAPFVERLAFPDDYELLYAIAVGYPDESPEAKPRDMSKILFID